MTSFHHAGLTGGRTAFHRNRELAPAASSALATALAGLTSEVDSLSTKMNTAKGMAVSTRSALSKLQTGIGSPTDPGTNDSLFGKIKGLLQLMPITVAPSIVSEQQAQKFWTCGRALNRVEDLLADSDFNLDKNGKELTRYKDDHLVQMAKSFLTNDLATRLANVHRHFERNPDPSTTRWERFLEVHALRQEIMSYLATSEEEPISHSAKTPQVDSGQNS